MDEKEENIRNSELVYLAMRETSICDYSYDPETKSIDIPEYAAKRYGLAIHYDHMPYSFADAHIAQETKEAFCNMYLAMDRGERFAKCEFRLRGTDIWISNSMSRIGQDEDGNLGVIVGIVEDISHSQKTVTEYSRMINALGDIYFCTYYIDARQNYYKILKQLPDMESRIRPEGNYSAGMDAYAHAFVAQEDWDSLLTKCSLDYINENLSMENKSVSIEYRRIYQGKRCWCRAQLILVDTDKEGRPWHLIFSHQDIDQEKTERELKDSSLELLRDSYFRIGCVDLNANSMVTIKALGGEEPEIQKYLQDYKKMTLEFAERSVAPEDRDKVKSIMLPENLKRVFDEGNSYVDITYRRLVRGEYIWVRAEFVAMESYSPENARVMFYVKNIAEEKAKETELSQRLLESNAKLKLALQSEEQYRQAILSEAMIVYQVNISQNRLEQEIVQEVGEDRVSLLELAELEAPCELDQFYQRWGKFISADTQQDYLSFAGCKKMTEAFQAGRRTLGAEFKARDDKNREFYIQHTTLLKKDELSGDLLGLCFIKDLTRERLKELQTKMALQDAYEAANRANQAKSDFLSNMSHDIRTPMNAIVGMTAIAAAHMDDRERVMDCLNKITRSSKHLLSLINEVLDMSKIESGKIDLAEEEFNLSDLIENLLSMVGPSIKEKHHTLNVNIENIVHEEIIGDSLRIQQAFVNIMSNAVKYTPDGGTIHLHISEKPTNRARIGCYEFIFEDNGIGMKPEFAERIFEPFLRAEDVHVRGIQGTGLGMAIARNIVRMMDGDIRVESSYGCGSRFTATIYLKLQSTEEVAYEDFVDLRVLVADDEQEVCESTCGILDKLGMNSEWVLSGREAVEKAVDAHSRDSDYFAVILDWKMPDMDGLATAREIRRLVGPDIPIIVFSSYDWSEIEVEARRAGVDAFISKPLFQSRLTHLFKKLLGGERGQETKLPDSLNECSFTGKRVLLAEDNDLNLEIATEILQAAGLTVEQARDGREAVDKVAASDINYYDMVFMDIQMPVMNGYEAAIAIRALERKDIKQLPIVAMTANAFAEDVQNAKNSGMNEHIAKPLDLKHLNKVLNYWLRDKKE